MYKIEKLKSFLDCDQCTKLLVNPVVMACGKFICKIHLEKILTHESKEKNTFICKICQEKHVIPKNGFVVNNRLQDLLDVELNKFEPSPVFDECMKELEEAKASVLKIEQLETNPESYIYYYFEDIKRQVDLRREDLKYKIDTYSDEIIKSIETTHTNCMKMSKEIEKIAYNIDKSKKELNELIMKFDTLKFDDEKYKGIKTTVSILNQDFKKLISDVQYSLLGNKEFAFQFKELMIEDIFGRFSELYLDSIILDKQNQLSIKKLCELPSVKQWKLQYRATRDGFSARNFHTKCDGSANTLTIIKSTNGNIFGGFTEKAWDSTGNGYVDPKTYIFSLVNRENRPFKAMCTNGASTIYCYSTHGPIFGSGHDILITSGSNANKTSYSNFGYDYKHTNYQYCTDKAKSILAGSYNFQTLEIEVFVHTI